MKYAAENYTDAELVRMADSPIAEALAARLLEAQEGRAAERKALEAADAFASASEEVTADTELRDIVSNIAAMEARRALYDKAREDVWL